MKQLKLIISGGGTGGHIYPAIAIADECKRRYPKVEILFVGAKDRMEMQKVPQAGYPIEGLWISGIQRSLSLKNLAFPFKLVDSLIKARQIIKAFAPDVVVGTGGFASGPLLKAANQKMIPTLLQEQNSYAGITNKWLANKAGIICVAYENMADYFPHDKLVFTGNPVRQDLLNVASKRQKGISFFGLKKQKKTVLILGGSLGSRRINELIAENIPFFQDQHVQLIWQCGKLYFDRFKHFNEKKDIAVYEFLDHMDLAYAAADVVLSRSGALSVSELCLVGKPVIFIPSSNVAEDHQTKNAEALADKNAALMIRESELEKRFRPCFASLMEDEELQNQLRTNILKRAKPSATEAIVDELEKLVKTNGIKG